MLRLWLDDRDLARVRLSADPHPLGTVILGVQVLRQPSTCAQLPGWSRASDRLAAKAAEIWPLLHLIPSTGYLPDFLTPLGGIESIEAGIDLVRSTPARRIRAEVAAAYRGRRVTSLRRRLADADRETVDLLAHTARRFFDAVLADDWPRLVQLHRTSVLHAAQALGATGLDGLLARLHPAIAWRPPVLEIDTWWDGEFALNGQGIILAPSLLAGSKPRVLVEPCASALVVYPATPPAGFPGRPLDAVGGLGAVAGPTADHDSLAGALGRTRAAVLRELGGLRAQTTTSISQRLGISLPSASEHVAALRAAGLVSSRRRGRVVEHALTAIGAHLLDPDQAG